MRTASCSLLLAAWAAAGCMSWPEPRPEAKPAPAAAVKPKPAPPPVTPEQVSDRDPYAAKAALEAELDREAEGSPDRGVAEKGK